MLTGFVRSRLGQALVSRLIERAKRTPYFHIRHGDGQPYMDRFWLLRIGGSCEVGTEPARQPWVSLRVHHIQSSDWPEFHDHPWSFLTWILRGGYDELKPLTLDGVTATRETFQAGSVRLVRAETWHYLELAPGADAWTLVLTFPKCQSWGFLYDGKKMPWRQYLAMRRAKGSGVQQEEVA